MNASLKIPNYPWISVEKSENSHIDFLIETGIAERHATKKWLLKISPK